MTEPKFTPGPWWPVYSRHVDIWYVMTGRDDANACHYGDRLGATISSGIGDHTEKRTSGNERENAHLIAAAPDLYEALKESVGFIESIRSTRIEIVADRDRIARLARAALAKARGEEG